MLTKQISSLQHPIVKQFVRLRSSKKDRYAERLIPLMGNKLALEAPEITILLHTPRYDGPKRGRERYLVSEEILKKVTGQVNPEPVAALAPMPPFEDLRTKTHVIALDGVSDPGNVGTLMRTAYALGMEGMFLTPTCADPFNDKVLRAAMGAALRLPLQVGTKGELLTLAKEFTPLVADPEGTPMENLPKVVRPLLILGSESQGISPDLKAAFPMISIPIRHIDSLNVGAAGAIIMYHLVHDRSAF